MATKTATPAAVEPIDRLEEKITQLVTLIGRLRQDHARVSEDNARLAREVDLLKTRLAESEGASAEVSTLRLERDEIRSRVSEMLQQLDALSL
jgi:regulator of replication initiation timing